MASLISRLRRWGKLPPYLTEERFDAMSDMQKRAYLRHPAMRPRCECGRFSTRYGVVDDRDGYRHGPTMCQPLREVIR